MLFYRIPAPYERSKDPANETQVRREDPSSPYRLRRDAARLRYLHT